MKKWQTRKWNRDHVFTHRRPIPHFVESTLFWADSQQAKMHLMMKQGSLVPSSCASRHGVTGRRLPLACKRLRRVNTTKWDTRLRLLALSYCSFCTCVKQACVDACCACREHTEHFAALACCDVANADFIIIIRHFDWWPFDSDNLRLA